MIRDSQTQMTNDEIRRNTEIRMTNGPLHTGALFDVVPTHAQMRKGAFHEPLEAPPGFGVRQSSSLLALWRCRRANRKRQPPSRRSGAMARREGGRTGA